MVESFTSKINEYNKTKQSFKNVEGKLGIRHLQAVLLFFGMVMAFATRSSLSIALVAMTSEKPPNPDYQKFNWNEEKSIIMSGFLIGLAIMQIPFGYIATVKSAHKLHSAGMFISGILHALVPLMAYKGEWVTVAIGRVLTGVCQASLMSCNQILLSRWSPPFERSRMAMFIFNGSLMGNVITLAISGVLAASPFGWPSIFYLFGCLTSIWAAIFYYLGADSPAQHSRISPEEKLYIESSLGKSQESEESQKVRVPWSSILTSLPVWCLFIASGGHNWGFYMLITQLPNYMSNVLNFDIKNSGFVSALPYLCAWLLAFPYSWVTDYCLKRGASITVVRKVANSVAIWGPAAAMLALSFVGRDQVTAVIIMVIAVSLNCGVFCGFQVSHVDISPNFSGTLMSITNTFGNVMGFLAPLIFKLFVKDDEDPEQWNIIFYLTAFLYFITNAVYVIFCSSKKQPWNERGFSKSESTKNFCEPPPKICVS